MKKISLYLWPLPALLFLVPLPSLAQSPTPTPTPAAPLPPLSVPGELPRFEIDLSGGGRAEYRRGNENNLLLDLQKPFRLRWGDVVLQGDEATFDQRALRGSVRGGVFVQRGDELVRGDFFVFDGKTAGFETQNAVAISPPFSVRGQRIFSDRTGIRAERARVALRPDGGGEVQFDAEEARLLSEKRRLTLHNARIGVYGMRLLTVRYLSIPFSFDRRDDLNQRGPGLPLTFRASQISGTALGLDFPFTVYRGVNAQATAEQTFRQGTQYQISLQTSLLSPLANPSRRDTPLPGAINPAVADRSLLWQLLTARALPVAYDPVLDFTDITAIPNPLINPTDAGQRGLNATLVYASNREFAGRRQGPLLLSRRPELNLIGSLPLSEPIPIRDNGEARAALQRVRLRAFGEMSLGQLSEVRLNEGKRRVSDDRRSMTLGLGTLPLLVGNQLLLAGQASLQINNYASDQTYQIWEVSAAGQWVLGRRLGLGAAFIRRTIEGTTPFFFDQIDTQNEAQFRALAPLPGGRYTVSGVARYDLTQEKLFDWEIAVGIRGSLLEPRFSYRRLNGQFGFTIGVPGLIGL